MTLQGYFYSHVLPGGKAVLFTVRSGGDLVDASIAVISLETGDRRILMNGTNPRYVPTGHIIFAQPESRLMAVPFDLEHLSITGSPVPVLEDVQISANGKALFSISNDGSLLYVPGKSLRSLVWVDRQGSEQRLAEIPRPFLPHPRLSPDGQRLAVTVDDPSGVSFDIWILELARGTTTRLTFEGNNARPIWSPDGRRIIHNSNRVNNRYQVFSTPTDGSGEAEQLTLGAYRVPTSLSSDGKTLVFRQYSYDSSWDIGMLRLDGEHEPEILIETQFNEHTAMISPDNRWLAYVSDESGRDEIYIRSFPDVGSRVQISTDGGTEPMWSRNGRELFYRNGKKMMVVDASTDPNFMPSKPTLLFEGRYVTGAFGGTPGVNYDVAPDGQRFVMVKSDEDSGSTELNIILNWFEELKRLK